VGWTSLCDVSEVLGEKGLGHLDYMLLGETGWELFLLRLLQVRSTMISVVIIDISLIFVSTDIFIAIDTIMPPQNLTNLFKRVEYRRRRGRTRGRNNSQDDESLQS